MGLGRFLVRFQTVFCYPVLCKVFGASNGRYFEARATSEFKGEKAGFVHLNLYRSNRLDLESISKIANASCIAWKRAIIQKKNNCVEAYQSVKKGISRYTGNSYSMTACWKR